MTLQEPPAPELAPADPPPAPANPRLEALRQQGGTRRATFMHVVRRVHLYSGIFLVPWVLLYGFTAFLFNHPTVMTERERAILGADELAGTSFDGVDADALAAAVVDALRAETGGDEGGPTFASLSAPTDATFTRTLRLQASPEGEGVHSLSVELNSQTASLFHTPPSADDASFEREDFAIDLGDDDPRGAWRDDAARVFADLRGSAATGSAVRLRSGPTVAFDVEVDGVPYRAHYDVGREELSAEPLAAASTMPARSFLLRLHLAHVFPSHVDARWVWSVIVDLMALSMVTWGTSGLLMWWQIRRTRAIGTWLLVASVALAGALGLGMWSVLTA